ncbi:MAG: DUF4340 domain-containing protein [Gammaproteobacteria bacterium]|jgi:hypothetical protein|nr:DUF4340 domain-containing protein [Gammaproteobacteria bacterium]
MNAKKLIILGVGTVLALMLALVLVGRPDPSPTLADDTALLPGLADGINDVDALEIVAPDGETVATLHRERERWRMREMHDYEADFARIHDLLRDLARATRLEGRTDRADWYGRLGVADPGSGEGSGVVIRFPGSQLPGLIVGERDPAGIGRYVRLAEETRAWLTDQDIDLPVERIEWLERAIMDIPVEDIESVTVRHGDGDEVDLRPADEAGGTWVMLDAPPGREVEPAWQLRQTANALARLNMTGVRPHDPGLVPEDAVETVFATRDGMVFTAISFSDESGSWVHFRVGLDERGRGGDAQSADAESGSADADASDSPAATGAERTAREIDVVAVDGRLSPWQFALAGERFDRLRPTTEYLLVAPEESGSP